MGEALRSSDYFSEAASTLRELAEELVFATYAKAVPEWLSRRSMGDASVVVAQVVDWQQAQRSSPKRKAPRLLAYPEELHCNGIDSSRRDPVPDGCSLDMSALTDVADALQRRERRRK